MQDFRDLIESKGARTVQDAAGVARGTVDSWKSRRRIPRDVWPDLLLAFPELGLNDLIRMEGASK